MAHDHRDLFYTLDHDHSSVWRHFRLAIPLRLSDMEKNEQELLNMDNYARHDAESGLENLPHRTREKERRRGFWQCVSRRM
jgi:hypothetical protein